MNTLSRVHLDYHTMLPALVELTYANGADDAYLIEIHADGRIMGFLSGHGRITNKWWHAPWKLEFLRTFAADNAGHVRSRVLNNPFTKNSAFFLAREDCTDTMLAALNMNIVSPDVFIAKVGLGLISYKTDVITKVRFLEIQNDLAAAML